MIKTRKVVQIQYLFIHVLFFSFGGGYFKKQIEWHIIKIKVRISLNLLIRPTGNYFKIAIFENSTANPSDLHLESAPHIISIIRSTSIYLNLLNTDPTK